MAGAVKASALTTEEDGEWRARRDFLLMILLHSFRILGVNRRSKFRKNRTGKFKHSLKNWYGAGRWRLKMISHMFQSQMKSS